MGDRRIKRSETIGRPHVDINWIQVEEYLCAGCIGIEIASKLGISPHTLYDRCLQEKAQTFTSLMQSKKAQGDLLLKETQYRKAVDERDNAMLIWLGKNRLGQRENPIQINISPQYEEKFDMLIKQMREAQIEAKMPVKTIEGDVRISVSDSDQK